jgi:hypothetical protein
MTIQHGGGLSEYRCCIRASRQRSWAPAGPDAHRATGFKDSSLNPNRGFKDSFLTQNQRSAAGIWGVVCHNAYRPAGKTYAPYRERIKERNATVNQSSDKAENALNELRSRMNKLKEAGFSEKVESWPIEWERSTKLINEIESENENEKQS